MTKDDGFPLTTGPVGQPAVGRGGRLTATTLLIAGLLAAVVTSASATPLGDARQRAAALRANVNALQVQAESATEQYDGSYAQLAQAVTAHVSAQHDLNTAQDAASTSDGVIGRRVRALYMTGGAAGLYAQVLTSGDLSEVSQRIYQITAVLKGDQRLTDDANHDVLARGTAERRLGQAATTASRLQAVVGAQADQVRALLDQTNSLLAAADQDVRALAVADQRAADQRAAARAAAALAQSASRPGLLSTLPPGAATTVATAALTFAQGQLGKPYLWGATGPAAYDCSGLTGAAYAAAGLTLPRTAQEQWFAGPQVALADLRPGDLLFWATDPTNPATIHHVGFYAGAGLMLAAPHTGDVVKVQPLYLDGYIGAIRPGGSASG